MIAARLADALNAHRTGDVARARALYDEVLQLDPNQADAFHMLGLLAQQSGDLAEAARLVEQSVSIQPNVARVHYNLAIIRALRGDVAGAIVAYEAAIRLAPDFADAHSNLGNLYLQRGRREEALQAYMAAIRAKPDFAPVYSNLAVVLIDLTRFDDAIFALQAALRLEPHAPEIHANLGQAYRRSGRYREAISATQRALELRPNYLDAYLNLALAAFALNDFDLALEANQRARALAPASAELNNNRSSIYHVMGKYADAIASCDAAIALRPDYAEAHVNRAVALLVTGDFTRGWEDYVWMWRLPAKRAMYPYFERATLWNGEPFAGKELLITREQGYGDAIQVARYLPAVKALGGRVILEVAPALDALFMGLPGVDEFHVSVAGERLREGVDLQIPLLGLPRALATDLSSIPAPIPYLRAPTERVERWRNRFQSSAVMRVGIAWAGSAGHDNDRHRSCRLEDFAALGDIEGVAWFGLQKEREEVRSSCGALTLKPLGAEIEDFADTAAIISHLDLVIAVDTAIVHLAGALGKPVWTLLAFIPDWRWMLERADSPWYPTMRLFRQSRSGDWDSVFAEVALALRAVSAARRGPVSLGNLQQRVLRT